MSNLGPGSDPQSLLRRRADDPDLNMVVEATSCTVPVFFNLCFLMDAYFLFGRTCALSPPSALSLLLALFFFVRAFVFYFLSLSLSLFLTAEKAFLASFLFVFFSCSQGNRRAADGWQSKRSWCARIFSL